MQDPILFWNEVALEANRKDHTSAEVAKTAEAQRGPTLSSRALAIVHLAMHDAFFAVNGVATIPGPVPTGGKRLYLISSPAWAGANTVATRSAAVTGAAATTLCTLYSAMRKTFEEKIGEITDKNGTNDAAFEFGRRVALAVLATRKDDDKVTPKDEDHAASPGPGRHRVDPYDPGQGYLGVGYGQTPSFAVTAFQPQAPPPAISSAAYNVDFGEVAAKGGAPELSSTTRTTDETAIGVYWAYDGANKIGTPPRLYNQIVRAIAESRSNTTAQNARLFALINCAMGDSGIHAWHWKYCYDLWRPVVGVREHDPSTGPSATPGAQIAAACDPFWKPLGAPHSNELRPSFTPPFPAYPSGHATFGAAAFEVVRRFYGHHNMNTADTIAFEFVSDELNGTSTEGDGSVRTRHKRVYSSMAKAIYENSISRIYLGVHWRFDGTTGKSVNQMLTASDNIGGVPLGRAIAKNIFDSGMKQQAKAATAPTAMCVGPSLAPRTGATNRKKRQSRRK